MNDTGDRSHDEPRSEPGSASTTAAERDELLEHIDALVDKPLTVLGLVWLVLVIVDLAFGLNSTLLTIMYLIWALFILDFILELVIAPDRLVFVKGHWLTLIALAIPAFRVFAVFRALRVIRAARFLRAASLARILTSTNRALRTMRLILGRWQLGMVLGSTVIVTFSGAGAIYAFEKTSTAGPDGIHNFGDAIWWSAMMMTTMGSQYWPQSYEGRIVAWLIAVYAFAFFGYVTAFLASHFLSSLQGAARTDQTSRQ